MIELTLRSLHAGIGRIVPSFVEAHATFALQNAARYIAQNSLCIRETVTATLGSATEFPYQPAVSSGYECWKIMSVKCRVAGSTDSFQSLPETEYRGEGGDERGAVPGFWVSRDGMLYLSPMPSVDYEFKIECAVSPIGEFDTVTLPSGSEEALIMMAAGELLIRDPASTPLGRNYLAIGRNIANHVSVRSKIGDSGTPHWTIDPNRNYFRRMR